MSDVNRRDFLGTMAAAGAAMVAGGVGSVLDGPVHAAADPTLWIEKSIPQLQGRDC